MGSVQAWSPPGTLRARTQPSAVQQAPGRRTGFLRPRLLPGPAPAHRTFSHSTVPLTAAVHRPFLTRNLPRLRSWQEIHLSTWAALTSPPGSLRAPSAHTLEQGSLVTSRPLAWPLGTWQGLWPPSSALLV